MKPAPFAYHRPGSVAEAVQTLAGLAGEGAKVLAGGQSLVPLLSMRLAEPAHLVDINHLPGLAGVEVTATGVRVGALARHARVLGDAAAAAACPLLGQALAHVAHPAIRNRGTTVGSIVHADPAAEAPAVLALLGGTLEVVGPRGRRTLSATQAVLGPMETGVASDELAVAATFPAVPAGSGTAFVEVARRRGDYAVCAAGALVTVDGAGAPTAVRVVLVGVGPGPVTVDLGPAVTAAGGLDETRRRALVDEVVDPGDDVHASAAYRRHLAHVLTARAVERARDAASARPGGRAA